MSVSKILDQPKAAVILGYVKKANEQLLINCIQSLKAQSYRNFEIHIYDNSCLEDGLSTVKQIYPDVIIQKNNSNLGFAGGNNSVLRKLLKDSSYKYLTLLNDDTAASPGWLESLIKTAEEDGKIGAVTSKLVYYEPYVRLAFTTQTFNPSKEGINSDSRELGLKFYFGETKFAESDYTKKFQRDGFYGNEGAFSWTNNRFVIDLPIGSNNDKEFYTLFLSVEGSSHIKDQTIEFTFDEFSTTLDINNTKQTYTIEIPAELIKKNKFDLIQNASSGITAQFNGYDIGSVNGLPDIDNGQFDFVKNAEMICGGAVLFRADALRKTGIFDEYFFVYYEDSDLSLRLKSKGYRLVYQPKAFVRHIHAGSSTEYSPLFSYHVWKNKPAFVIKNFGLGPSLFAVKELTLNVFTELARVFRSRFVDKYQNSRTKVILKSAVTFYMNLPLILLKKFNIIKSA